MGVMKIYLVELLNGPVYGLANKAVIRAYDEKEAEEIFLEEWPATWREDVVLRVLLVDTGEDTLAGIICAL